MEVLKDECEPIELEVAKTPHESLRRAAREVCATDGFYFSPAEVIYAAVSKQLNGSHL